MAGSESRELLRRIARLAKQNQELEENVRELMKINEQLRGELDSLKEGKYRGAGAEEGQKSLRFNMVTVLYAGIRCYSARLEGVDSTAAMDELDEILFEFDRIVSKYNIQKIKTIGDTYMCAGGIPEKNITNPVEVVIAAIEMRNCMSGFESARGGNGKALWKLNIGVHTGPVTAVVSGKKKVSYDLKGDTVNIASRVMSAAEDGMIAISVMTLELIKEFYDCDYYGKLPVKYKGDLEMYTVKGIKPDLSLNPEGTLPNEAFGTKFGLIRFTDLQEIILDRLEKELPGFLCYHNVKHTVDVVTEVELIGWNEGCSDEEVLLLKTAALLHDAGHTIAYDNHEYHGTIIAREILPKFDYTEAQIDRICSLIMSTKLPPRPADLLESIMCDSDLDYLGRTDFIPVSNTLYDELKAQNKIGSLNDWNKLQVKFISGHQYYTKTARSLREVNKQQQIERIRSLITD